MADTGEPIDQERCSHLVLHKSVEESCPEVMYCIYCGKTWTLEEWEVFLPDKGITSEKLESRLYEIPVDPYHPRFWKGEIEVFLSKVRSIFRKE